MGSTGSKAEPTTQAVPSQEDYEATLESTDIVIIYLSLIKKLPSEFDLHLFLIIQSYAGLSFTLSSANNYLHRGEQFENALYHQLKRRIPTKRNFIP